MAEQETATLPAEDASLKELVEFDSARRDELSETQQARITEYTDMSGAATATAVADTTTRLTTEHADATAEERRVSEIDAKAADDKTYYEKWRPLETAATEDERAEVAAVCMLRYNFSFPMVLDDMTDVVGSTYMAMPERLYVLDTAGRVTWKCGLGPHLFDPDGFEAAIKQQIAALAD